MNTDVTAAELDAAAKSDKRILPSDIDALMKRVEYKTIVPEGTTTTLVIAMLDGKFRLSIGESACVDPANFNAEIGERFAKGHAETRAKDALWEMEGYRLYREINN